MCGLTGFWGQPGQHQVLVTRATAMADTIRHRGPDADAVWSDAESGLALGHRRLSILDLSPAGAQPMVSSCGRFVIAYNGEVYNHAELIPELAAAGVTLRGHSDTETLLEAFARFGVEAVLPRLAGMYAFALWDRRDRRLVLARDPLGIKPLYWGRTGDGTLLFGSELKALRAHPAWDFAVDPQAVAGLLSFGYVPAPLSIHGGVSKLPPGHTLTVEAGGAARLSCFWPLTEITIRGQAETAGWSDAEATDHLEALLRQVTGEHLLSDVPVGAFLSGGVDSSTVVAMMKAVAQGPVRTFTIGYGEAGYDESAHADAVARHLGTEHTKLRITAADALAVVPQLADMYDEPFADSSQIPTFLVSRLARRHVTVALSGDGGDELFAGYNRHVWIERVQGAAGHLPGWVRRLAATAMTGLSADAWDRLASNLPGMPRLLGNKMHKLATALTARDGADVYRSLVTLWPHAHRLVVGGATPAALPVAPPSLGAVERVQFLDTATYLPDDILTKVDRASMAVSLESRVPLLDRRVAEFAWRLPRRHRLRHGQGKWLLRQVLYRHVPRELIERPKMGFAVPIGGWLRGPLRPWAEDLLSEAAFAAHGLLDAAAIRRRWLEHLAGRGGWDHHLWAALMFQAWWQRWEGKGR